MEKVRPIHIQEFQQYLVEKCSVKNREGATRSLSNNYIKQFLTSYGFNRTVILEVIEENPVDTIGKIRTERSVVEFWTVDELKKYIIVLIFVIFRRLSTKG